MLAGVLSGVLGLRSAVGRFQEGYGRGGKTRTVEVLHEEWTLDGEPLRDVIRLSFPDEMASPVEEVTLLSDRWVSSTPVRALERLLAGSPGDFDDGRIALYVCQVDGDFGCATLSVEVAIGEAVVEWRNLGWQVDYLPDVVAPVPSVSVRFERAQYESLLTDALARWRARDS